MAENVRLVNGGYFVCKMAVRWNDENGNTQETSNDTGELAITQYSILEPAQSDVVPQPGASCWIVAYVEGGPTHESGDNFDYCPGDGAQAVYTINGTVDFPSFSKQDDVMSWED